MVISPILFSGLKEDSHKMGSTLLLNQASAVYKQGKDVEIPFKIVLEAFAWAKWFPLNQPLMSLISQGRCSLLKLCRPLKILTKGIDIWKRGAGVGKSTVSLGKGVITKGFCALKLRKVISIAQELFKWLLGLVNWTCKVILLASDEFLRSIANTLPDTVSKIGVVSAVPLASLSVMKQVRNQLDRRQLPQPDNSLLKEARASTDKVMSYVLMGSIFKMISLCFSGLSLFSIAAVPALIPLSFSTAGLTSTVAALYAARKGKIERHYVLKEG